MIASDFASDSRPIACMWLTIEFGISVGHAVRIVSPACFEAILKSSNFVSCSSVGFRMLLRRSIRHSAKPAAPGRHVRLNSVRSIMPGPIIELGPRLPQCEPDDRFIGSALAAIPSDPRMRAAASDATSVTVFVMDLSPAQPLRAQLLAAPADTGECGSFCLADGSNGREGRNLLIGAL